VDPVGVAPQGTYRPLDFGELSAAYERLAEAARIFRPIVHTDDPDPAAAVVPIYQAAIGTDQVSTCTELQPVSDLPVWDVNHYYRAIGVRWPYKVNRSEMRRAYTGIRGQDDRYATYALKWLLDREFRAHYDQRPLGQPVDDRYRWEWLYRQASAWAAEQSKITGNVVTATDLLGKDIRQRLAEDVAKEQEQAEQRASGTRSGRPERPEPERYVWLYAYYHWGSRCRDEERLAAWQQMLVSAFARQHLRARIAVGFFARTDARAARVRHRRQDGEMVEILFLHEEARPTPELAGTVVATYHNQPYGSDLPEPVYLAAD
jgi:hypothetical protein